MSTTDDRPTDPIRDAFEAMLWFLACLIGPLRPRKITPAEEIGALAACEVELDPNGPDEAPLLALRDLIQRAAEEHNRRAGYFVRAATGTLDGDDADDAASYRAAGDFTPERIREARERCERATPGPWLTRGDALLDDHIQIKHIENGVTFRIARVASFDRTAENAAFIAHAREDLPAALAEIERRATHAATWKALARRLMRRYRSERRGHDLTRSDRKKHRAEIERLTAELAARAPADASLEARDAMTPIGDAFARLGKHLETAHRCMNGVHVCDIEEQEEAIKAAVAAYAEIQTVRARYADASDIGKRAYLALDAYRASDSWLAVVRAVDASRPAAPGQTPVGPAARITEEDLAEIEARTADPPLAGDGPALRRLAAEVRALRGERDATAEKGDVFEAMLRTREAEITRLRAELAARAVPAADASLEARAREARKAFGVGDPYEAFTEEWKERWRSVVRAVDASRPGLTEEQIETLIFALRQRPPFDGDGDLLRALRAMKHDARRASRGETARAADTLGRGIGGEPIKIRPTTTKDPSQ